MTLCLVLHELATNAGKYGALGAPGGRTRVSWTRIEASPAQPAWIELVWTEEGGPAVAPPTKQGFGSRLIAASAEQLGGEVAMRYEPAGAEIRFRFPLPDTEVPG